MRSQRARSAGGWLAGVLLAASLLGARAGAQEQAGSIRGEVQDEDFGVPLAAARVKALELGQEVLTNDQGAYVFGLVPPGRYTLVFTKDGYVQEVQSDVVVVGGQLTDVDVALSGAFTEMEEFVVQDLQLDAGSEASLLNLRFESAALLDSIGSDLLSRAGASDAAAALTLVSGATVQEGKFAVIRGLPDRYVSSQLNGVRLPSSDETTRAVELDQFPSAVLESIQVSKTFTPDQQGDASGGAVDVHLKGIPPETILEVKSELSYNTNVGGAGGDFLSYSDGGINFWGNRGGDRDIQPFDPPQNWKGAVGVSEEDAPIDYKFSAAAGGKHLLDSGLALGGFASFFYERDSSFYDDGVEDNLIIDDPGGPMVPEIRGSSGDFTTSLNDVTRAEQGVQWGGLGSLGLESENHSIGLTYLYTRNTVDSATLSIDTRGKEFFFPGHDPDDPSTPGHDEPDAAPYLRQETLEYTERTTSSLQPGGHSRLPLDMPSGDTFQFHRPELDWTLSRNMAVQDQPDKRQFGATWKPERDVGGFIVPATWGPHRPASSFFLGNAQRIFEKIEEDGDQISADLRFPFDQWSGDPGYFQLGLFNDQVDRTFRQETFSNPADPLDFQGDFDDPWSAHFPFENHPLQESLIDIDYDGDAQVAAWYGMLDVPLTSQLNLIGGARVESTKIEIVNDPESQATWFPPGAGAPNTLEPGEADVDFEQEDLLPSIGLVYRPHKKLTLRGAYGETVARQTFRELSAVIQQEYLGGPIFIGNPELQMSGIQNWDLRADWTPYDGGLFSLSWFYKDIQDPIEFVQVLSSTGFTYTTPRNYPEGKLSGIEGEVRQELSRISEGLEGFAAGINATFIDSEVEIPDDEAALFDPWDPMSSRDATNAPEHLYNLYLTYDHEPTRSQAAVFYTVRGDTLVAGAFATPTEFIPNVYETEYGTLNFTLSHWLTDHVKLEFKAKNLTNPEIEEVYRSGSLEDDVTHRSFTKGREFSIGLSVTN